MGKYEIITAEEFYLRNKEKVIMVDIEMDEEIAQVEETVIEDKKTAVKMGFIGVGQGGCNIADAFYNLGYQRVLALNTTAKDLQRLKIPEANRMIMGGSAEGAGKTPSKGKKICEDAYEDIFKKVREVFKSGTEHVMICVGAGGGTGDGASTVMVKLAKEFLASQSVANPEKKVGVILTLPTKEESSAVQGNAHQCLVQLIELAEKGQLSPLVIVDNAQVMKLYGNASVVDVWSKANKNIAALFNIFNEIPAQEDDSCIVICDPADYRTVLQSGIMTFGRTKLDKISSPTDISDAVRNNVKKGLLVEGLDISQATAGAAILLADEETLGKISQDSLEQAFGSLNRLMKQSNETKLHRGVYKTKSVGAFLYTLIAGLGKPTARLNELAAKSGAAYPIS
jgi:cell division GTPase FtsZ